MAAGSVLLGGPYLSQTECEGSCFTSSSASSSSASTPGVVLYCVIQIQRDPNNPSSYYCLNADCQPLCVEFFDWVTPASFDPGDPSNLWYHFIYVSGPWYDSDTCHAHCVASSGSSSSGGSVTHTGGSGSQSIGNFPCHNGNPVWCNLAYHDLIATFQDNGQGGCTCVQGVQITLKWIDYLNGWIGYIWPNPVGSCISGRDTVCAQLSCDGMTLETGCGFSGNCTSLDQGSLVSNSCSPPQLVFDVIPNKGGCCITGGYTVTIVPA